MKIYNCKQECYGCTSCMNSCPVNAISMKEDEKGFQYPEVNKEKCINCGLCKRICPYSNFKQSKNKINVYGVKNKDEAIRSKSTSGGVFTLLANIILNKKGRVYGCILDKNLKVVHIGSDKQEDIAKMRGSKYVQSDLNRVFSDIKKDLEKDKYILFTGTPCQCAGLRNYLRKDYEKLYICDIICHGVPSPKLFKEHLKILEKKGKVENYIFRSKINGWHNHTEVVCYENNHDYKSNLSQSFRQLFGSDLDLRDCCYECKFTNLNRVGDITIGDFWNLEKTAPEFDDNKGTNLVIINSQKGEKLFKEIKKDINYIDASNLEYIQSALKENVKKRDKVDKFWKDYQEKGYEYVLKKYTHTICMMKIRAIARKILKR